MSKFLLIAACSAVLGLGGVLNAPANSPGLFTGIEPCRYNTLSDDSLLLNPVNKHLTINSDSRIDTLLQIHREENIRKGGIDGYRVQIYQGTKENALQMKSRFIAKYDDIKVYVLFPSPDFKVRIGDFRTRSEAIHIKHRIEKDFPDAFLFIVEDIINYPSL